jgi:hypothetical protein
VTKSNLSGFFEKMTIGDGAVEHFFLKGALSSFFSTISLSNGK